MARWKAENLGSDQLYKRKRDAVIRQAARAFGEHGFHGTSLDEIAKALSVTKAALYYYVRSKQEILFECHTIALDLGDAALQEAMRTGRTGLERLSIFVKIYIEMLTGELGSCALLTDLSSLTADHRRKIIGRRDHFDIRLRAIIEQGIADESIAGRDTKLTGFLIMGAVNWVPRWFSGDGPRSGTEVAEEFVQMLAMGLAPRSKL
ncbi:MAG: TetR/AcrR family transcriptional regulator [Rhodospirillales bacterium]